MLPVFFGFSQDSLPTGALFCAGWPALGLAAAVLLDREPDHRIGRTMVLLAMLPAALVLTAVLTTGGSAVWDRLGVVGARSAVVLVLVTLVALGWAVGLPDDRMSRRRLSWFLLWSCLLVASVTAVSLLDLDPDLGDGDDPGDLGVRRAGAAAGHHRRVPSRR